MVWEVSAVQRIRDIDWAVAARLVAMAAAGCSGSRRCPVTGVVKLDGKPAGRAFEFTFGPRTSRPKRSSTSSPLAFRTKDGKFSFGAPTAMEVEAGEYKVTICQADGGATKPGRGPTRNMKRN